MVAIHELGHLMVGRWCGIKAEVYSIGFGKVLWSRVDRHGTKWQIAALPLGGYVKFLGDMDPASARKGDESDIAPEDRHRAFHNATLWRRALTVLAGPVANFLLSILIVFLMAMAIGKPSKEPVIADLGVLTAKKAGFKVGDRIVKVGNSEISNFGDALIALQDTGGAPTEVAVEREGKRVTFTTEYWLPPVIVGMTPDGAALAAGVRMGDKFLTVNGERLLTSQSLRLKSASLPPGEEITVELERDGKIITLKFTPKIVNRQHPVTGVNGPLPTMGVSIDLESGIRPHLVSMPVVEAAEAAVRRVLKIVTDTLIFIHAMVFQGADTSQLAGPIGIAKHSAAAASHGLTAFIMFMAFVSTAIGLFNLFPIPILDGGHLCFYLYEWVRGRPTNDTVVRYSTMAGLSLLLLLMVFVTFNNDLGLGEWFSRN